MNTFLSVPLYPPGSLKLVVRYDFDTFPCLAYLAAEAGRQRLVA